MRVLFFLMSFMLFFSSSSEASNPPVGFWGTLGKILKVATVDAAGALGGAGSVASISAGLSTTNPVGWGAMGAGAVVGGAGASIAYAARVAPGSGAGSEVLPYLELELAKGRDTDNIGIMHNRMVYEYLTKSPSTSTTEFAQEFLTREFGSKDGEILLKVFMDEFNRVNSVESGYDYVLTNLPKFISHGTFEQMISGLNRSRDFEAFIRDLTVWENQLIESASNEKEETEVVAYFSTLNHSFQLWDLTIK